MPKKVTACKKLFLQVFARLWGTPVTKYTRYGSHLITFMATTICHQGDLNLFSVLIRIWFLESSKIPLEVNCQVNWGQTIYKLLIMAGHRVQEHLRGLNLCYSVAWNIFFLSFCQNASVLWNFTRIFFCSFQHFRTDT